MNWNQFSRYNKLSKSVVMPNAAYIGLHWLSIVATLLSVAIINTFPFYYPDSAGYAGYAVTTLRSPVPGALAHFVYPWLGAWSLPLISSAILATILTRCIIDFRSSISLMTVLIILILSGAPIFSSLILSDVWILAAIGSILVLSKRLSMVALILGAISISGHAANFPIIMATIAPIVLFSRKKVVLMIRYTILILLSCGFLFTANYRVSRTIFPETFGPAIIASKILNDVPEALYDLCGETHDGALCNRIGEVKEHAHKKSSYFIWSSGVGRPTLRQNAWPLVYTAVTRHTNEFLFETFDDFIRGYSPSLCFDFSGYMDRTPEDSYAYPLIDADTGWLSRAGVFNSTTFCEFFYILHLSLYFGLLGLTFFAFWSQDECRGLFAALICALLANDLVFATLSGMNGRYHFRIVGIVLFALILNRRVRKGNDSDQVRSKASGFLFSKIP